MLLLTFNGCLRDQFEAATFEGIARSVKIPFVRSNQWDQSWRNFRHSGKKIVVFGRLLTINDLANIFTFGQTLIVLNGQILNK